jgi:hypothetical protein
MLVVVTIETPALKVSKTSGPAAVLPVSVYYCP